MGIKKKLRPFVRYFRYLIPKLNSKILYYTSRMQKLKSESKITDVEDIKRRCQRKDTIFIMGCGYSINDITKEKWRHIVEVGDIFSFNEFYKGKFVPINYHICGEITAQNYALILINNKYKRDIKSYYDEISHNPFYKDTIFFLRYKKDMIKEPIPVAIWALFFLKAFKNKPVCPYRIVTPKDAILEPSNNIHAISHNWATLFDAVNIAYILGYKKIVLVGVDLYDRRYFWLEPKQSHEVDLKPGKRYFDIHDTAENVVRGMKVWRAYLAKRGVKIYIYNPRSLLNKVLPVYRSNANDERG